MNWKVRVVLMYFMVHLVKSIPEHLVNTSTLTEEYSVRFF